MPPEIKILIKKKFRATVLSFYYNYKMGLVTNLPALDALREFLIERKEQNMKLHALKQKVALNLKGKLIKNSGSN
jgi:hypothetical protein